MGSSVPRVWLYARVPSQVEQIHVCESTAAARLFPNNLCQRLKWHAGPARL